MATKTRVSFLSFSLLILLISTPFIQVARCQSDSDDDIVNEVVEEGGDLGIVGDDVQDFGDGSFSPAPGVETVCVFPKNPSKFVAAGEETELLVGIKNEVTVDNETGEVSVNVIAVQARVHLPYDHRMLVQNLSAQAFRNATIPPSAQATFPYIFAVSKFLQPGSFDLVGTIVYEIDQQPFQSTFYNGTIEVIDAGGLISVESVFLISLGVALLVFLGLWIRSQFQNLSKKTKRAPKVEVGTGTTDASMDEWLQVERERNLWNAKLQEFENLRRNPYSIPPNSTLASQNPFPGATPIASPPMTNTAPPAVSSFSQFSTSLNTGFGMRPIAPNNAFGQSNPFQASSQVSSGPGQNNFSFGNAGSFGSQPPAQPFGSQLPSQPFGSQPPAQPFGSQPPAQPFGSQPPAQPFGSQPPAQSFGSSMGPTSNFGNAGPFGSQLPNQQFGSSTSLFGTQSAMPFSGPNSATNGFPQASNLRVMDNMPKGNRDNIDSIWLKEEWNPGEIPEEAPPDEAIW